jgi:hypothetical protein
MVTGWLGAWTLRVVGWLVGLVSIFNGKGDDDEDDDQETRMIKWKAA